MAKSWQNSASIDCMPMEPVVGSGVCTESGFDPGPVLAHGTARMRPYIAVALSTSLAPVAATAAAACTGMNE